MFKKLFLLVILLALGVSFWVVPNFEEISTGVAFLLFGMVSLEIGFKSFAEGSLKKLLAKATNKFYKSFTVGMVATAILQSSSLISVITISFLSAGLISLYQGIGIIYGANLGTTATAWLVATLGLKLDIAALAMPMIVFGIVLYLQSRRTLKGIGNILAGLGFFFYGIAMMKTGFEAYQNAFDLTNHQFTGISGDLLFVTIGILLTVILQSSSATIAIILTVLAVGQISYVNALALAIGANVGTTVTAIIAALASNIDGKRIAVAHFFFKLITGVVAFAFLKQLTWLVDEMAILMHIGMEDYALKLAIFHTVFNLLGIIMLAPFTSMLVKQLQLRIKDKKKPDAQPMYLNEAALAFPQTALQVMLDETKHLFALCFEAIAHGLGLSRTTMLSKTEMKMLDKEVKYDVDIDSIYYARIKNIYGEIIRFGIKAQHKYADARHYLAINGIMEANRYFIEVVKDVKDLQPNVLKYSTSDNKIIRNEYNNIRKRIARFIRIILQYQEFKLPKSLNNKDIHLIETKINDERNHLNKYIEKLKSNDLLYNGSLNKLLADNAISGEMLTSLINDSRITNSINKHLMKAAELLYINTSELLSETPEDDEPEALGIS